MSRETSLGLRLLTFTALLGGAYLLLPTPPPAASPVAPAKSSPTLPLDFIQIAGGRVWFGWTDSAGDQRERRTSRADFERIIYCRCCRGCECTRDGCDCRPRSWCSTSCECRR